MVAGFQRDTIGQAWVVGEQGWVDLHPASAPSPDRSSLTSSWLERAARALRQLRFELERASAEPLALDDVEVRVRRGRGGRMARVRVAVAPDAGGGRLQNGSRTVAPTITPPSGT